MNNIIITEASKNIRLLARQALHGMWKPAFSGTVIFSACLFLPVLLIDIFFGSLSADNIEAMMYGAEATTGASSIGSLYSLLVEGAFTFGFTLFFLEIYRKRKADLGNLFAGFGYYFKTFGLAFVISVFTLLWACLLIVPGIIAAIRYSQAFFILADDPSKGIMQCINESKALMNGNKAKYFCLQWSFIGWYLLMLVAVYLVAFAAALFSVFVFMNNEVLMVAVLYIMIMTGMIIIISALIPYVQMATTIFYEMVTGKLKAADEIPQLVIDQPEQQ